MSQDLASEKIWAMGYWLGPSRLAAVISALSGWLACDAVSISETVSGERYIILVRVLVPTTSWERAKILSCLSAFKFCLLADLHQDFKEVLGIES